MAFSGWKELEPGVWGLTTPAGLDFLIEDISDPNTGGPAFQASQLLRTCCTSQEHHLKRFPTLPEARSYIETLAANQQACDCC